MFIEIDMMAEEEDFIVASSQSEEVPEEVEAMDDLDHLYMDEQLYLQSIFDLKGGAMSVENRKRLLELVEKKFSNEDEIASATSTPHI